MHGATKLRGVSQISHGFFGAISKQSRSANLDGRIVPLPSPPSSFCICFSILLFTFGNQPAQAAQVVQAIQLSSAPTSLSLLEVEHELPKHSRLNRNKTVHISNQSEWSLQILRPEQQLNIASKVSADFSCHANTENVSMVLSGTTDQTISFTLPLVCGRAYMLIESRPLELSSTDGGR